MNRIKDNFRKMVTFFYNHKVLLVFIVTFFAFFFIYIGALAENNYDNKLQVKNLVINNIKDGTESFDLTEGDGNDTSDNNGIVRNFDSISYSLEYILESKTDETITVSDRKVIVDVLIPFEFEGNLWPQDSVGEIEFQTVFENYSYAEFTMDEISDGINTFDFLITNINADNGKIIEPIIIIKESTDENKKSIEELTEEERNLSYDNFNSDFTKATCNNTINDETSCKVSVTGTEKYEIKLFKGSSSKNNLQTTYPVGIMVALKVDNEKGIKGVLPPKNISFDLNIDSSSSTNEINYVTNSIRPYKDELDYKVYIDESLTETLPVVIDEKTSDTSMNGQITAVDKEDAFKRIEIANIKFSKNTVSLNGELYYYLSTNSLEFTSTRTSETLNNGEKDINLTLSAKNGNVTFDTLTLVDHYKEFVGELKSKISFFDESSINELEPGIAFLNYGQEFNISNELNYATTVGDSLDSLTNYLKIDNDVIDIITNTNNLDYDINIKTTKDSYKLNEDITSYYKVSFGYGTWDKNNFTISTTGNCPNTTTLTKDELMNLYGGPCVTEKEGAINWVDYLDSSLDNSVMLVKLELASSETDIVYPTTNASITLKAKIKDDYNLVNTISKVVTSSTGMFSGEKYYLTDSINTNDNTKITNKDNYIKTSYNFDTNEIISLHSNTCENNACSIYGNSLIVSAFKINTPTIKTYRNSYERSSFSYYPIEWRINANAVSSDSSLTYLSATVYVYMPDYLNLITYGTNANYKTPVSIESVVLNGENYKKIIYIFDNNDTEENIKNLERGILPELSLYTNIYLTTKNGSEPKVYAEVNFDAVKIDNDKQINLKSNTPKTLRMGTTDYTVRIYNNSSITMLGTTTPEYIEKNSPYTFKMQAYNNSESASGSDGYQFSNATLYYVLPYKEDTSYSKNQTFTNQEFSIKLSNLPSGYEAFYSTDNSLTILNEISSSTNVNNITWTKWSNVTTAVSKVTGIKIVKTEPLNIGEYFMGEEGVTATITPINNSIGDIYYNSFTIVTDKPSAYYADINCEDNNCEDSQDTYDLNNLYFSSSKSSSSVYSRKISGIVFEDYNYNGIKDETEELLENIPISVYKLNAETFDSNNPLASISDKDELISETTTGVDGAFTISGLEKGNYYIKYNFNNEKYTPTDKYQGELESVVGANMINSKAVALAGENAAVSDIISFTESSSSSINYINLGLKLRKEFTVELNKYITNVTIYSSNNNPISYDYDNATKVDINVKNLKNTSFRVTYKFELKNTKYFPGYVGIIADRLPDGMTFDSSLEENKDWVIYDNVLYYTGYSKRLIIPGQKYYFTLVLDLSTDTAGSYVNIVAARDLVLMGDEVSDYDFSSLNLFIDEENQENNEENDS